MSPFVQIFIPLLLHAVFGEGVAADQNENLKMNIEYFEHVNLSCTDGSEYQNQDIDVQFWILPSGEILHPPYGHSGNVRTNSNGTALEIDKLDDFNFGLYICIIQTNCTIIETTTDCVTAAFTKGINVEGPYYGEDMVNEFKRKAVVGGISAGVVLGLIIIVCLLTTICKHGKKTDVENGGPNDVNAAANGTSQSKTSPEVTLTMTPDTDPAAEHTATKIGDSIYDTADNLLPSMPSVDTNHVTENYVGKDEESVPSESGHYTSIGSLERDLKPCFGADYDGENDRKSIDLKPDEPNTPTEELHVPQPSVEVTIDDKGQQSNDIEDSENQMNETRSEVNSNDDKHVSEEPENVSMTSIEGTQDDGKPVYAKPMKRRERQTDMVDVVIVQGEVIIEPNGISVPVTTVSSVSTPISDGVAATSEIVGSIGQETALEGVVEDITRVSNENRHNPNVTEANVTYSAENACGETEAMGAFKKTDDTNGGPSSKTENVNKDTEDESSSNCNNIALPTEDEHRVKKQKFSSVSSSCSETSKSTVDDETIAHFENVLASLVGTKKTKSVSSLSNESDKDPDAATSMDSGQNE